MLVNFLILVFAIGRCALVLARWRKEERGRSLERDSFLGRIRVIVRVLVD